ncbi:MAG: thermonuclease family protein [Candidatus Enteromonas sp.]|nr:thermonuclease family protein [Candidatus Enteromonas sp.]
MKNKTALFAFASLAIAMGLSACGGNNGGDADSNLATVVDATSASPYGTVTYVDFDATATHKVGEVMTFKVAPKEDFFIDTVSVNGKALQPVKENADGSYTFSWTLEAGRNRLAATYVVDSSKNFVESFKLNIPDDVFAKVQNVPSSASDDHYDFRKDGIERIKSAAEGGFMNYVDGDTTHVETYNFGYTVKIRYLGIDTPESTSDIEEWGKAASLFNKSCFEKATQVILQSQGWARGDAEKSSTTDGNGRNLAYVWYATVKNPTKEDFRCLNLEMVYEGYSQGIGSLENLGEYYYLAFTKAGMSAEINKRGQFQGIKDPYYDYGEPEKLSLKEIYKSGSADNKTDSSYLFHEASSLATQKPWRFIRTEGYVTRKINGALYIQDKPSYEQTGTEKVEAYGIYIFTYAQTDIMVGDKIEVVGVLSVYGGCYQIQGIKYSLMNPDERLGTKILSSGHEIKPVKMSYADFNKTSSYNDILVEFTDELYCYNKTSTYQGVTSDVGEGGTEEINKYNEKYPFYNSTNKLIFYAKVGSATASDEMRIVQDENIRVYYGVETSRSYKFYVGGTVKYYPNHPEYVNDSAHASDPELITNVYQPKKIKVTAICQNYLSTSGKTQQYSLVITAPGDVNILGTY